MLKNMFIQLEDFNESEFPFVTVIVAARNEEKNIGTCIESLLKTDYPRDKLEIFIVDDRSTDKTKEIILEYSGKFPEVKLIEVEELTGKLKGKPNALLQAIKKSHGEIILTTDADCIVKSTWIKEMVRYYDKNTGVVASYSIINPKNVYNGIQSLDWIYLLTIASGSDAVNLPLSCVGNNMSYRRIAYEEVGGYEKIKFSVTEDFMLLKTIRDKTRWKTKFPVNFNILNYTLPCDNLMGLYRQKKRWGRGGLDIRFLGYIVGLLGWSAGAIMLFGWLFTGWFYYLILVLFKFVIDLLFILPVVIKFRTVKVLLFLPFFEIYFALYAFLLPFILLFDRDVVWKEQKFR
jgi:cellulose synthase/poly-beta-1,6-N-acetylglucosamine synthase-like glycosyltransferase